MDIETKQQTLTLVYRLFENFYSSEKLACKRRCATCCTCNITLTTLEGYKIITHPDARLKSSLLKRVHANVHRKRFLPQITTNGIAQRCMTGKDIPDEDLDPEWGPCPLLSDQECSIYLIRPFGCRCMMSYTTCAETGYADIDDFTLTVANLFNQYIEHLDQDGLSGNLLDILLFFENNNYLELYTKGMIPAVSEGLIPNIPIPVLMIPPEHRQRIQPLLNALGNII